MALLLSMVFCCVVGAGEDPRGSIAKIMRTKKLTLNIQASGEPYIFRNKNGLPTGFTMDLQKMLAKDFGADLYITDVDFSGVIPGMLARKTDSFDMICAVIGEPAAIIVEADSRWKTFQDFLDDAKKRPGDISLANAGSGNIWHLSVLGLEDAAGVAVGISTLASFFGGFLSAIICAPVSPQLAKIALEFGPGEYSALAVFGITIPEEPR